MSSRLTLIDSLDGDKSFSSLGNIVADAIGIKTIVSVPSHTVMDHYEDPQNNELVYFTEMI